MFLGSTAPNAGVTVLRNDEVASKASQEGALAACQEDYVEADKIIPRTPRSMEWDESDRGPDPW
jgi:hypothetical protein